MDPLAHASIAVMTKRHAPKTPLWLLIGATQVPDLLFFLFEATGIEHQAETSLSFEQGLHYLSEPLMCWSHGLTMNLVWSVLVGGISGLVLRDKRSGVLVGSMVFSHWLLDALVYPVMPVGFKQKPQIGLGLITSKPGFVAGIIIEVGLIVAGVVSFIRQRKRRKANTSTPANTKPIH